MAQASGEIVPHEHRANLRGPEGSEAGAGATGGIEQQESSRQGTGGFLQDFLETLLLALVLFVAVRATLQNTRVDGHSMEPALRDGQYLLVNKLAYKFSHPRRGDIVVFPSPQDRRRVLIKRIVGLPGEEVAIVSGQVYINGVALDEPYILKANANGSWGPRVLGPNEYLVLGDNRDNSNDSRSFGPISEEDIIGKAWFSLWPPGLHIGQLPQMTAESNMAAKR